VSVGGGSGVSVGGIGVSVGAGVSVAVGGGGFVLVGRGLGVDVIVARGRRVRVGPNGVADAKTEDVLEGTGVSKAASVLVGPTVGVGTNAVTAC